MFGQSGAEIDWTLVQYRGSSLAVALVPVKSWSRGQKSTVSS